MNANSWRLRMPPTSLSWWREPRSPRHACARFGRPHNNFRALAIISAEAAEGGEADARSWMRPGYQGAERRTDRYVGRGTSWHVADTGQGQDGRGPPTTA